MIAGIIAAGEGSRLKSEGITVPKPLVALDGVPLIERLIRAYARHGITEIICIINDYSLEVRSYVERQKLPIPVRFLVKTTPSSMHSLFALAPHLGDEQFLLSTVDSVFDEQQLGEYLSYARMHRDRDGILAVTGFVDDENPLFVRLDAERRIQGFSKSDGSPWVTGGLYVFSPKIFDEVEAALARKVERLRNFLSHLLDHHYWLEGFPFGTIVDVDHVTDIAAAEKLLRA